MAHCRLSGSPSSSAGATALALVLVSGWQEHQHPTADGRRIRTLAKVLPNNPIAQTQRAALARLEGAPEEAIKAYQKALILVPDYDLALKGLELAVGEAAQSGRLDHWSSADCQSIASVPLGQQANNWGVRAARQGDTQRAARSWRPASAWLRANPTPGLILPPSKPPKTELKRPLSFSSKGCYAPRTMSKHFD